MVNIAICGAGGKMGHVVASCIAARDDAQCIAGIDAYPPKDTVFPVVTTPDELPAVPDVIVDFSNPAALDGLLSYAQTHNTALVLATTGYSEAQMDAIHAAAEKIPVFFTANMSLGINLLVELAKKAASVLGGQFDIEIIESHHHRKLDAPSGTALMIADAINETLGEKCHYVYERHSKRQKREQTEIGIHSIRGGTIVGKHEILFAGNDEVITLTHTAASRTVFAVGAVNAAVFLKGKPAGLYNMQQLIEQ